MGERRSAIIISATVVVLIGLAFIFGLGYLSQDEAASEPLTEVTDVSTIQTLVVEHDITDLAQADQEDANRGIG